MIIELTMRNEFGVAPDWESVKKIFEKAKNVL